MERDEVTAAEFGVSKTFWIRDATDHGDRSRDDTNYLWMEGGKSQEKSNKTEKELRIFFRWTLAIIKD